MQYTLERKGSFPLINSGEFQCIAVGATAIDYELSLTASFDSVDTRGFVVDHNDLNKIIQEKALTLPALSCELLASVMHNALVTYVKSFHGGWFELTFKIVGPQSSFKLFNRFQSKEYESGFHKI